MAIHKTLTSVKYTTAPHQQSRLKITANTGSAYLRELAAIVEILKDVSLKNIDTQEIVIVGTDQSVVFKPQKDGVLVYSATVKVKPTKLPPLVHEVL